MKPHEIIKKLMQDTGIKFNSELARRVTGEDPLTNKTKTNFNRYLSGDVNFPDELRPTVAKTLGTTVGYIWGGESSIPVRMVPVSGTSSCGSADINHMQEEEQFCYYHGDFWHKDLYCVIANGDSMAPEIENGDEIICDPTVSPHTGDMVHYRFNGEDAVKVLIKDDEAHLVQLVPYSQSPEFRTRTIRMDDDEFNDLRLSVVVAVNKLKFRNRGARLRLIGR